MHELCKCFAVQISNTLQERFLSFLMDRVQALLPVCLFLQQTSSVWQQIILIMRTKSYSQAKLLSSDLLSCSATESKKS